MTKPAQPTPKVDDHVTAQSIEIFRAGTHVDMSGREFSFSTADLADIASSYDPDKGEAPLVIGHPEHNAPAYGWVTGLRVDGDVLFADVDQLDAKFADAVRAGRFKKRSASFYPKTAKNNPVPGRTYLRHVGFLGAAVPAVTGLKEVNFADDDECIEFAVGDGMRPWVFSYIADLFRSLRERLIETDGLDKANVLIPSYQVDGIREAARDLMPSTHSYAAPHAPPPTANPAAGAPAAGTASGAIDSNEDPTVTEKNAEFAAREQELKAREDRIAEKEAKVAERAEAARREDAVSFADGLITGGKLLPKDKATVVELLLVLPTDKPMSFADGGTTIERPATELFRGLLDALPQRIDFDEKSGAATAAASISFAAPAGALVDANQLALHDKAVAYQAQHPGTTFIAAVKAVGG